MGRTREPQPSLREVDERAIDVDAMDVPAAVVCTRCGRGDCPGCADDETGASGVIAIVPWERPATPWGARFYETMQATTRGAEGFFMVLPDGQIRTALSFACLAELFAVGSTAVVLAPIAVVGIPGLLPRFLTSGATRATVTLATAVAVVGFSVLLVFAHAVHGLALGQHAKPVTRSRALRIGLYGCGWDLGSSPAGVVWAAALGGSRAAMRLLGSSVTAPSRAVDAALEGLQLDARAASRAKRRAMRIAMAVSVPAVMLVLVVVAGVALFTTW
jgi:hypothetical protein